MITQDELHEMFTYSKHTGEMKHRFTVRGGKQKGQVAGSPHNCGYLQIMIHRKKYLIHRLIFVYVTGRWPDQIDHKNGDRSDNRWSNLRECNYSQNHGNRKMRSDNKSGYKGVFFTKDGYWVANVANTYIGCSKDKGEAIAMYDKAAKEHFGKFALTNGDLQRRILNA